MIEVGEMMDMRFRFVPLDRESAQVDAGVDDLVVQAPRAATVAEIEGEGAGDAAALELDRDRPAGAKSRWKREMAKGRPQRIGRDVSDENRLAPPGGGAT